MNLREFWAVEAAKLRDTSALLDTSSLNINSNEPNPIVVKGVTAAQLDKWISNNLSMTLEQNIISVMKTYPHASFKFDSIKELRLNLYIRIATINCMLRLERSWSGGVNRIANYPNTNEGFYLPPNYWLPLGVQGSTFITKNVVLKEAIDSILKEGSKVKLDCNRMSVAIAYSGLSDVIGLEGIKKLFSNALILGTWGTVEGVSLITDKYYEKITNLEVKFCLPGDIVYFRNSPLYKLLLAKIENYVQNERYKVEDRMSVHSDERFNGGWAGEFCVCTGIDKFAGFGLSDRKLKIEFSSDEIRRELLSKTMDLYNLIEEKAKPILFSLEKANQKKSHIKLADVSLHEQGYRLNTNEIVKKYP